jgi:hypothetical protein
MVRSPIFEAKQARWGAGMDGRMPIPLSAAAFFLALLLVTAVAALAGGFLGVALPAHVADLPRLGSTNGRADRHPIDTAGFSQGFNGHGWEQVQSHQETHHTSE